AVLLSDQPSLKAFMSTNDRLTVGDGSESILQSSHADLLILEKASGEIFAFHSKPDDVPGSARKRLMQSSSGEEGCGVGGGHLYDVSLAPIIAGANADQHGLGRMALGREVSSQLIVESGAFGKSAFAFERQGAVILSSLPAAARGDFEAA